MEYPLVKGVILACSILVPLLLYACIYWYFRYFRVMEPRTRRVVGLVLVIIFFGVVPMASMVAHEKAADRLRKRDQEQAAAVTGAKIRRQDPAASTRR